MKSYYGRRVRIYRHSEYKFDMDSPLIDTGETGRLLELDVHNGQVMVEGEEGNLIRLFYKLVKLI